MLMLYTSHKWYWLVCAHNLLSSVYKIHFLMALNDLNSILQSPCTKATSSIRPFTL